MRDDAAKDERIACTIHRPLVVVPQHFGCLVFDRRTAQYYPFDAPTTRGALVLMGSPIVDVVESEADYGKRTALREFFHHFYGLGFFTVTGRLAAEVLAIDPPADHLAGPLAVHLEIVAECNLRCSHCFAGELPKEAASLTTEQLCRLFSELAAMGSFRLGLTGGEPLMRRDLFDVIDAAHDYGLHPCLTTNGLLIDEHVARQLGRRRPLRLSVSLEGATASTNDAVRGTGTFDRVLANVGILGRHAPFSLAMTVMRTNLDEIEDFAALAREVGAEAAVFRPLYPVGRARQHIESMTTWRQYAEAIDRLAGSLPADACMHSVGPAGSARRTARGPASIGGCGAGETTASISADGDVSPCSFLGSEFVSGNLRQRSFAEIWHTGRHFVDFRQPGNHQSGESQAAVVSGGCRARALALSGSAEGHDPWFDEVYDA